MAKQDWPLRGIYELNKTKTVRVVRWIRSFNWDLKFQYEAVLEDGSTLTGEHEYFQWNKEDPKVLYAAGMNTEDELKLIQSLENIEADHVFYGGNEVVD